MVRRSAPFATLPRSAFEATLDLLSGKYPSTEFAELRPRLVYDRDTGTLTARPGAQRLAVTSGGAIPDRGLFTVYLATDSEKPSRVGELDEEMVYESRPGDVISLGATSWRITEITHDRVLVIPAPGQPARLPFWRGDDAGRPAELGAALGAFTGELAGLDRDAFEKRCAALGFDDYATDNLWLLLDDQRTATTVVPTDTTLLVERFRDELGDWRVILHSPYGLRVHGPLALAVSRRLRERYGIDEKPTASDDGIVVRLPDTLERRHPAGRRTVRLRRRRDRSDRHRRGRRLGAVRVPVPGVRGAGPAAAAPAPRQPLAAVAPAPARGPVARRGTQIPGLPDRAGDGPGMPAGRLRRAHAHRPDGRIAQRRVRLVEVETAQPSPFAASLLFGYVGAFMYEGDSPLAERRAAALSLDTTLLAELLGRVELRELLDPEVIAATGRQLQHLTDDRKARDAEAVADLLRLLGPLTEDEVAARAGAADVGGWLEGLRAAKRALTVSFAGRVGGWPSRTSAGCATGSGWPFRSACRPASPRPSPIRSASCSAGSRAPTPRSPPPRPRPGSAWACGWPPTCWADWRRSDGRLVRGEFVAAVSSAAAAGSVVRRRGAAYPAPSLAGRAACPGRAGQHRRLRAFLPAWQQVGRSGSRGPSASTVCRHRPACRRADPGLGDRAAGVRAAGPRLPACDARRAAGLR